MPNTRLSNFMQRRLARRLEDGGLRITDNYPKIF